MLYARDSNVFFLFLFVPCLSFVIIDAITSWRIRIATCQAVHKRSSNAAEARLLIFEALGTPRNLLCEEGLDSVVSCIWAEELGDPSVSSFELLPLASTPICNPRSPYALLTDLRIDRGQQAQNRLA